MTAPRKILVLYTGGTIGMQPSEHGLVPATGFESRLRAEQSTHPERRLPEWIFDELTPPLDSANMTPRHWLDLRDRIVEAVDGQDCDGVLVLHGTDTLAYTASALTFLLIGLPAPVVLTGAMLPAGAELSDAWPNLFGALEVLGAGQPPGVQVFFHGTLMHGARVSKLRSDTLDAFYVTPRTRLGEAADAIAPALGYRQRRAPVEIAVCVLYPGMQASHLNALLESGVQGVVIECYGSGTGPSDDEALLSVLRAASARGVVLVGISQCPQGHVEFSTYAAGSRLRDAGLISGGGMTREAALGKLFALLGAGVDPALVRDWMAVDLCGELLQVDVPL